MSSFLYSQKALESNVWPMLECLWTRKINICLNFQPPLPKTHHHSSPTTTLLVYSSTLKSPISPPRTSTIVGHRTPITEFT
ncbi:hypothetical protein Hanom_Chr00s049345g01779061 [Helianthus anomalus]